MSLSYLSCFWKNKSKSQSYLSCFWTKINQSHRVIFPIALNFIKQQGTEEEIVVKPEVDLGEEVTEEGTEHLGGDVGDIVTGLPEGTELVTTGEDDSNQVLY
jgi:hypothetical protein